MFISPPDELLAARGTSNDPVLDERDEYSGDASKPIGQTHHRARSCKQNILVFISIHIFVVKHKIA